MGRVLFDHMWKRYGDTAAVRDLTLEVADGEFLCLVGPSGCGKTTALRCLAGLEEISEGQVLIDGRVATDLSPKDRDIAMVFQSYALYPHMTVFENMAFGLRLRKMDKGEVDRRVHQAADVLDLERFLSRKPSALSGGQRQRVALGRAIVREPSAFLMDEPLSNLDAKLRVQTRAELARLHQRLRTTTIYVTHDQIEAMTMGDRIAVMCDGVLHQVGTPRELYETPVNTFVAGFIGSPAMNFLTGEVVEKETGIGVQVGDTTIVLGGEHADHARGYGMGRPITVGIRPEHLTFVSHGDTLLTRLPVTVDVVEFLGNDELVHARMGNENVVALVAARHKVTEGEPAELGVTRDAIYLFDSETGDTLDAPEGVTQVG